MTTPAQSRRYAYLANNLNKKDFTAYYDHLLEGGRVEDFFDKMEKHEQHDQSTHGSWANGELSEEQKGVVSAWTSLSNKSSWRQIANDLSEGKKPNASEDDIKTIKTLVDAIKQNGVVPAEALGRAELLTTGLRWQGALPRVGDSLKNELSSATLDERTSERFSQYSDFGGSKGKPVIFHYGSQTKGLDVNRAGADTFADEQEWLVSGTFKITDKYSENGITHLNLKPIDEVKKHGSHDQKTHGNWATGSVPTSITTTTNAIGQEIQTITYGDIVIEREKPGEIDYTEDNTRVEWTLRDGGDAMRFVSSRIMGIENPSSRPSMIEGERDALLEGKKSPWKKVPQWISGAYTLMEDVRSAKPYWDSLHRGIAVATNSSILNIKEGQVIEFPLSATSTQPRTAEMYSAWKAGPFEMPVLFTFAKGTKATPIRFSTMADNSLVAEYVTQGKFKVVSVDKSSVVWENQFSDGKQSRKAGAIVVVLEHTDVFSVDKGGYEPIKP